MIYLCDWTLTGTYAKMILLLLRIIVIKLTYISSSEVIESIRHHKLTCCAACS